MASPMRALLQRVSSAKVEVEGKVTGQIGKGLLVFLGIGEEDTEKEVNKLVDKIARLRIFEDAQGKMNLSAIDLGLGALVISQFTLFADCKKGRRPNFIGAASPARAQTLYRLFIRKLSEVLEPVTEGVFGAHMDVQLVNDGPVTIWLDTDEL